MAIDTLSAALRQLNRLFAKGVVAGLSDAQLLELTPGEAFDEEPRRSRSR